MNSRFSFVLASALEPAMRDDFVRLQKEFRASLSKDQQKKVPVPRFEPDAMLAFDGKKMVGFVIFQQYRDVLRIPQMYIKPLYRPAGLGIFLTDHLIHFLQKHSQTKPVVVKWLRLKTGKEKIQAIPDLASEKLKTGKPRVGDRLRAWAQKRPKNPKPV